MGCRSCSSKVCSTNTPKGCKNNGNCGSGTNCGQLSVFNWLAEIPPSQSNKIFLGVEVRFKGDRKEFFQNNQKINLKPGDPVVVGCVFGHDLGIVSMTGELVSLQMQKKQKNNNISELKKIERVATEKDLSIWGQAVSLERERLKQARVIAKEMGLEMKLLDVEYQGDNKKARFYYTALSRIDFRELVKRLSSEFKIRVEMRQIGVRQEAAKLGGVGVCGRELCCSSWLTDFRPVTTSSARYQQLSINPQKLAGQCGKLKCCLNYELDTYLDVLSGFPKTNIKLITKKGVARFVKMDIFNRQMWYVYQDQPFSELIKLELERVLKIIKMNKQDHYPQQLEEIKKNRLKNEKKDYTNVVGQDSINRFDTKKPTKARKTKKRKNKKTSQ